MLPEEKNGNYCFNANRYIDPFNSGDIALKFAALRAASTRKPVLSDPEIIAMWLHSTTTHSGTKRAKRKEGERLVFFAEYILEKCLSEMDTNDIRQYIEFLSDPQPADRWVSFTKWRRLDTRWRPFSGPLSSASIRYAVLNIGNLFKWMEDLGLVKGYPVHGIRKTGDPPSHPGARLLPERAISLAYLAISAEKKLRKRVRDKFMFSLLYETAITTQEASSADMNSINEDRRIIEIRSDSKKSRTVPITKKLLTEFHHYRSTFGMSEQAAAGDNIALLLTSDHTNRRLSSSAIYYCITRIMRAAAILARAEGAEALAMSLTKASTHWLRHTRIRDLAEKGEDFLSVNRIAGHSSLGTTKKYFDIE